MRNLVFLMTSVYASEWRHLLLGFAPAIRSSVRALALAHSQQLADEFYSAMLQDPSAAGMLSHEQVQSKLMGLMRRWMQEVLGATLESDLEALVQQQVKIGQGHARVDVPVHMVLRGARMIKQTMHQLCVAQGGEFTAQTSHLAGLVVDHAMEIMSKGYASSRDSNARTQEAYRLFSVTQNLSTVRERRRAELLDWENQCLYLHAIGGQDPALVTLAGSDFGLWFRHKGMDLFQGAPETQIIAAAMDTVDQSLLPALMQAQGAQLAAPLLALREMARHIGMSLESLFERNSEMDAGRDVLTQLLNRKFLPVVLSKELAYAREQGRNFCVLSLDIDHFKAINDKLGHEAGDAVLQQLAAQLSSSIRGSDYLFRLGGEEFLMVLVDTSLEGALRVAENVRSKVAQAVFRVARQQQLGITVSIGVAVFDGHPDYQRILRQSDAALYAAKAAGRNCVQAADPLAA